MHMIGTGRYPERGPGRADLGRTVAPLGRIAGAIILATAATAALETPPVRAATITQSWQADWTMNDGNTNAVIPGSASGNGGGGTLTVDATMPKASYASGNLSLNFDQGSGKLHSGSNVDARINATGSPTSQAFGDFHFQSSNQVFFTDQLSVGAGSWGSLKITIKTNGNLQHNAQIHSPPYGFAPLTLNNDLQVNASLGAASDSLGKHVNSTLEGITDGSFSKSDSASLNDAITVVVPWTSGPVAFQFSYLEKISFDMTALDAEYAMFSAINDFGHTLDLFASVYDQNGVLMDGVTVASSEGISYQQLPADAPLPLPAGWLLLLAGMGGLAVQRRQRLPGRG